MSQIQAVFKGNTQQRLGAISFIAGAVLVAIGSILLPRASDLSNIEAMQKIYGDQAVLLQACALLIAIGFWGALAGTTAVYSSITTNGAAWVQFGFIFHIVGTALWTIGMSLDISYPAAIINWLAAAPENQALRHSVVTVLSPEGFGRGLFPLNLMSNWLAFALISIGILNSGSYPRWLGWYGMIVGSAGFLLGIAMTFTGREALISGFIILMVFTVGWWAATGIWMARKAWS